MKGKIKYIKLIEEHLTYEIGQVLRLGLIVADKLLATKNDEEKLIAKTSTEKEYLEYVSKRAIEKTEARRLLKEEQAKLQDKTEGCQDCGDSGKPCEDCE